MMRLRDAFAWQADACSSLGSPFMGRLMGLSAERWPEDGAVARRALDWPGDLSPKAESVPLRLASGLHALVITGRSESLAAVYPPHDASDAALWSAVEAALEEHESFLLDWIESPPQTNEVRRSAVLIPVAHMLAARFGLPLRLSELGASAGLNLNFDRFRLTAGDTVFGPESAVALDPDWTGPCPSPAALSVTERRGVDLIAMDATDPQDALRLIAYLWPDQRHRLERTRAAIALPQAPVDGADAVDWLDGRLTPQPGACHMIYSTVAWQYLPQERQAAGAEKIAAAGAEATEQAPLAWFRMEADGADRGAALTLRLWPGDLTLDLGRVDFHGRWVEWTGPTVL